MKMYGQEKELDWLVGEENVLNGLKLLSFSAL